ncbi:hypothetical protein CRG98_012843 [Punica granatum]|uniref:Uncharacterized protein n=1 Tax=Punica granatum TaxID=22663 RepID=A0A2I0KE98_PUNGR|nr:hypothetical protein CRG98_012843 [Punica granatum]
MQPERPELGSSFPAVDNPALMDLCSEVTFEEVKKALWGNWRWDSFSHFLPSGSLLAVALTLPPSSDRGDDEAFLEVQFRWSFVC